VAGASLGWRVNAVGIRSGRSPAPSTGRRGCRRSCPCRARAPRAEYREGCCVAQPLADQLWARPRGDQPGGGRAGKSRARNHRSLGLSGFLVPRPTQVQGGGIRRFAVPRWATSGRRAARLDGAKGSIASMMRCRLTQLDASLVPAAKAAPMLPLPTAGQLPRRSGTLPLLVRSTRLGGLGHGTQPSVPDHRAVVFGHRRVQRLGATWVFHRARRARRLRERFFAAGQAHAGVLLVLSLAYFVYLGRAGYSAGRHD
jgi:hypothetical protein